MASPEIKVAVVILNYNGRNFLERFLPLLIRNTPDFAEIIIADNKSTDDSVIFLNDRYPQLNLIQLPVNYGFAEGYNQALKNLAHPYFLLINSDIEVSEGWLSPLLSFLERHSEYACVQPKILDYNRKDFFEYAGACGGFLDNLYFPYCRGRIFDTIEKDTGQYDTLIDVDWATGACLMIRREVFSQMNGFDGDFFAHMEEIDLCQRILNQGHKIACVPDSTVFHIGGGTLNQQSPFKTYLNFRNNLFLILKNENLLRAIGIISVRFSTDLLIGIYLAKKYSPNHFGAILKAYWHFIRQFNKTRSKRVGVTVKKRPKRVNILWEFYIKRNKTFASINNTK